MSGSRQRKKQVVTALPSSGISTKLHTDSLPSVSVRFTALTATASNVRENKRIVTTAPLVPPAAFAALTIPEPPVFPTPSDDSKAEYSPQLHTPPFLAPPSILATAFAALTFFEPPVLPTPSDNGRAATSQHTPRFHTPIRIAAPAPPLPQFISLKEAFTKKILDEKGHFRCFNRETTTYDTVNKLIIETEDRSIPLHEQTKHSAPRRI